MFDIPRFRKASFASAAAAVALSMALAPAIASAQPAPPPPPPPGSSYDAQDQARSDYETCQQQRTDRGVAGAVIGGVVGGLLGSGIGGRGSRTGGTIVGAGVGALGGAAVGSSTADCDNGPPPPPDAYDDRGYYENHYANGDRYSDRYDDNRYDDSRYNDQYYGDRSGDDRYDDQDNYGGPNAPAQNQGDCTTANSPVYMPDGTVQHRTVQVCRDENGRYQPVD